MEKKTNSNLYRINIDLNIPKNYQKSFQTIFSYIRKKLQIKNSRKSNIDSLLKKCKGKFFKAVHNSIKICLKTFFKRLPQNFITNITIEYNKNLLYKKIIEIYREFYLFPSFDDIISNNFCENDKIDLLKEILNMDFYSLYEMYISSDRFKRDIKEVIKNDGKRNGILFEFVAFNFLNYYKYGKAHIQKDKKNIFLNQCKKNV